MTQQDFISFYPQFTGFTPAVVLSEYVAQANSRFSDFSEEDTEEARRLYVAHKLTLYVSYTTGSYLSSSASSSLADLPETAYGLQLLTLIRQYGRPRYVP